MSGRYAGPVSRLLAFAFDILTILGLFAIGTSVVSYLARLLAGYQLERKGTYGLWWTVALLVLGFVYFWLGPSITGRTAGMAVFGLRVVSSEGSTAETEPIVRPCTRSALQHRLARYRPCHGCRGPSARGFARPRGGHLRGL